jgi:hypothetical protein
MAMRMPHVAAGCLSLIVLAAGAAAQTTDLAATRIATPPVIDGAIVEDEWASPARCVASR